PTRRQISMATCLTHGAFLAPLLVPGGSQTTALAFRLSTTELACLNPPPHPNPWWSRFPFLRLTTRRVPQPQMRGRLQLQLAPFLTTPAVSKWRQARRRSSFSSLRTARFQGG